MQFCPPGYAYTRSPCTTPYILNGYPEILGEGNLASVVSPNGSMHLVFVPTSQWMRPLPSQNANNASWNPTTAWIIRSVLSPMPPTFYQQPQTGFQPCQNNSHSQFNPEPCLPPSGPFELKFHNDNCTSTSDILYFYPNLKTYETTCLANLRKCPSIRLVVPPPSNDYTNEATSLRSCDLGPMDTVNRMSVSPTSTSSFDMSDDADCHCRKKHKRKRKTVNKCECRAEMNKRKTNDIPCECKAEMNKRKTTDIPFECKAEMNKRKSNEISCECKAETNKRKSSVISCECKAEMNKRKSSAISCDCKAEMNKRKSNEITCKCKAAMSKIKNKKNNNTCECKQEADKGIATFTDRASHCVDAKVRETQTSQQKACNTQTCTIIPLKKNTRCGGSSVCTVRRCSSVFSCCNNSCCD